MIGNKIADKISSLDKTKSKEKEEQKQEIYIPPEKKQQIIDDLRLFWHNIKNAKNSQTYKVQRLMKYLDLLLKNG